jgi:5-formyltetrahydrofolate cyclo-ligase
VRDKQALRAAATVRRAARGATERAAAGEALAHHGLAAWGRLSALAAFVGIGTEPPTLPLLDALRAAGVRLLLPVIDGDDLDWAAYDGAGSLAPGPLGLSEPLGPRLGSAALRQAEVVLVPALAVDGQGRRLGRGRGYYDRTLALVTHPVVAVVYADDVVDVVPVEPHDRAVDAVLTPEGLRTLP